MKKVIIKLGNIIKYPAVVFVVFISIFEDYLIEQGLFLFCGYLLLLLAAIMGLGLMLEYLNRKKKGE